MLINHPDYFGVDIANALYGWAVNDFLTGVRKDFGEADFTVVVLKPTPNFNWRIPFGTGQENILTQVSAGASSKIDGPEGLTANVMHKLQFVLRTGLDSSAAAEMPWLLEPGDFPYAGAGTYRGFIGGVSGFSQDVDVLVFRRFVDKLIVLRSSAAVAAIEQSKAREPGMKYLEGEATEVPFDFEGPSLTR